MQLCWLLDRKTLFNRIWRINAKSYPFTHAFLGVRFKVVREPKQCAHAPPQLNFTKHFLFERLFFQKLLLLENYGGLAQLGARLVSKHTPSRIVLRQSNSQQKTPSKRFASWILWGISSAGRALAWHARGQRFDPAILHQKSTVLRWKYGDFLFAEVGFLGAALLLLHRF